MTAKPTSLSLNDDDKKRLRVLQETTGIRSNTEAVRFALRRSLEPHDAEKAHPESGPSERERALEAALDAHRRALELWNPTGFDGVRAKAAAEESLRGL